MYLTQSLQNFQQNIGIQKQIGQNWGYNLDNSTYKFPKVSKQRKQYIKINSLINPIKVQQKLLQQSPRLRQINKQIQQMQRIKKINLINKIQGKQLNFNKLINQMIRQYNYLIDHKQFKQAKFIKYHQKLAKIKQLQLLNKFNQVFYQIKQKQHSLIKTDNLLSKFNQNKQITELYKQYSNSTNVKLKKIKNTDQTKSKKKDKSVPSICQLKNKKSFYQIHPPSNKSSTTTEYINIQHPFASKTFLQKSYQINQQMERNKHIEELMKQKISKFQSTFTTLYSPPQIIQKKQPTQQIKSLQQINDQQKTAYSRIQQQKLQKKQKQQYLTIQQKKNYLSSAIKKRSPKFIKVEGGKFVKKFNCKQIAKQMIDGQQHNKHKKINEQIFKIQKIHNKIYLIPDNTNDQDKMVINLMNQQQSKKDQWTNNLNQKMNLLMKTKKRSS